MLIHPNKVNWPQSVVVCSTMSSLEKLLQDKCILKSLIFFLEMKACCNHAQNLFK